MHNTLALIGSGLCMLIAGLATSYWLRQRDLPMARLGGSLAGLLAASLFLSVVPLVPVQVQVPSHGANAATSVDARPPVGNCSAWISTENLPVGGAASTVRNIYKTYT